MPLISPPSPPPFLISAPAEDTPATTGPPAANGPPATVEDLVDDDAPVPVQACFCHQVLGRPTTPLSSSHGQGLDTVDDCGPTDSAPMNPTALSPLGGGGADRRGGSPPPLSQSAFSLFFPKFTERFGSIDFPQATLSSSSLLF